MWETSPLVSTSRPTSVSQGHDTCPYGMVVFSPFSGPENEVPLSIEAYIEYIETSIDQFCANIEAELMKKNFPTMDGPVLNLKTECDRRKTYVNWPLSFLDPDRLAAAGFYYLKKADLVRCAFCSTEIGKWDEGDDPMRDHQRWSPNCPYVKQQNVGNVPFGQKEAPSTSTLVSQGHDTCGPYGIVVRPFSGPENEVPLSLEEKLGILKSSGPLHKDFSTYEARLRSYKYWPVSLKQKPNVLSEAGFYYTGKGDETVCFHCGGGLKDWEDSEDPWVEHALWFSKCMFIYLEKGKAFIDQVCADKQAKLTKKNFPTMDGPVLNLKTECDRRKTYVNWPLSFLDPNRLAAAGFYYLKKADLVCCAFCNTRLEKWEKGDDPMWYHQQWFPNCPYVKQQNVGNVPFGQEEAPSTSTSVSQGHDTCGPYGIVRPFSGPENEVPLSLEEKLGILKSSGPLHKDFSTYEARLRSYKYWPVSLKQKPNVLSEAGFYYTGKGDETVCFHCGGGLKDWEDSDDPWVEHALWFSKCMFINWVKGKAFIDQVCADKQAKLTKKEAQELESPGVSTSESVAAETPAVVAIAQPVSVETTEESKSGGKPDDARLCKICFTEELGVLFLPCGHIIACVHCAPELRVCAACRQPFTQTVRAYLP